MRVLSLFDGMGCGRLALDRAGIDVETYYASEIDKYAMAVTDYHYPDVVQLGDIREWRKWDIGEIDMVLAGSPCQGFSNAGKGLNFEDERSKLYFEFEKILEFYQPKYWLLENVKMKGEWADIIDNRLGVKRVEIDSALVSAQSRKRYYWANWKITQPEDKGILLRDIIESGFVDRDKSYCVDANYYKGGSLKNYIKKRRRQVVLRQSERRLMVKEATKKGYAEADFYDGVDLTYPNSKTRRGRVIKGKSHALTTQPSGLGYFSPNKNGCIQVGEADINGHDILKRVYSIDGKSPSINTMGGGNREPKIATSEVSWRKLTVIECERLQTVPDNYTLVPCENRMMSNTQRYKMLGNGWTIDVIAHILSCKNNPLLKQMEMF